MGARGQRRVPAGARIAWSVIGAGFLYLSAHAYALELGAAHHDARCPVHGRAMSDR